MKRFILSVIFLCIPMLLSAQVPSASGYEWHFVERISLRLDAGIDNLANRNYVLPLGGRYLVGDKTGLSSVPAMGRSFYGGLTFKF